MQTSDQVSSLVQRSLPAIYHAKCLRQKFVVLAYSFWKLQQFFMWTLFQNMFNKNLNSKISSHLWLEIFSAPRYLHWEIVSEIGFSINKIFPFDTFQISIGCKDMKAFRKYLNKVSSRYKTTEADSRRVLIFKVNVMLTYYAWNIFQIKLFLFFDAWKWSRNRFLKFLKCI